MTVFPAWPFRTLAIWLTFPTAMSNVHYSARVAECLHCSPRQWGGRFVCAHSHRHWKPTVSQSTPCTHTHIYALSPTFTFIWHLISLMSEANNKKLSWTNITSTRARIYCRVHNPRTHVEISSQAHKFSAGWMRKAMPVTKSTLFLSYTVLAQIGGEKTHPLCGVLSYMISYLLW